MFLQKVLTIFAILVPCYNGQMTLWKKQGFSPCDMDYFICSDETRNYNRYHHDRRCHLRAELCDGQTHCNDGSDEIGCSEPVECLSNKTQYQCSGSPQCIPIDSLCDGVYDCPGKDDESSKCVKNYGCVLPSCPFGCKATPMGPKCKCKRGFELAFNGDCIDTKPCNSERNPCSQLCYNINWQAYCYCELGFVKNLNGSCVSVPVEPILLLKSDLNGYESHKIVKSVHVTRIRVSPACNMRSLAVERATGNVFYIQVCNKGTSIVMRQNNFELPHDRFILTDLSEPVDLAFDEIAKVIYFADLIKNEIIACSIDSSCITVIIDKIIRRTSLTIDQDNGYLYWSNSKSEIQRAMLDGSNIKTICKNVTSDDLIFDSFDDRLYWINIVSGFIEYFNFQTKTINILKHKVTHAPTVNIAIFYDHLIISNSTALYYLDKSTGAFGGLIINGTLPTVLAVYGSQNDLNFTNPCDLAPCAYVCLRRYQGYTCVAPNNTYPYKSLYHSTNFEHQQDKCVFFLLVAVFLLIVAAISQYFTSIKELIRSVTDKLRQKAYQDSQTAYHMNEVDSINFEDSESVNTTSIIKLEENDVE